MKLSGKFRFSKLNFEWKCFLNNVIYYVRLSDLCHKAYADYAAGAISGMAYNKIYAVCMDHAYPK